MRAGVASLCTCVMAFGAPLAGQSAWQRVQDLQAEVERLASGAEPAVAESRRRELLVAADALCDEAAKEPVDAHQLMELRRRLAGVAFELQLWGAASALYDDVHNAAVAAYGSTNEFCLGIQRLAAASRSEALGQLPFAERDYAQVLAMQRELALAWDSRLQADLAAPAADPLGSLREAVYARRELGLTCQRAGRRAEALRSGVPLK